MGHPYNLRSRREIKLRCYLREAIDRHSVAKYNPEVRLQRLNLQKKDFTGTTIFKFINNEIIITQKETKNKRKLLKTCLFTLICLTVLLIGIYTYRDALFEYYKQKISKTERRTCELNDTFSWVHKSTIEHKLKMIIRSQIFNSDENPETDRLSEVSNDEKYESINTTRLPQNLSDNPEESIDEFFATNSLTDYALQSRGAKVLSTWDTEPYEVISLRFWKYKLKINNSFLARFLLTNGPTSVLVPWTKPGDCWAFKGSRGRILIELSESIVITAISIDHVRNDVLPKESFRSAPKEFSVIGFSESRESLSADGIYLGSFNYSISGPVMQTFLISPRHETRFKSVQVSFQSNHDNKDYTCVYKIRVHGYP